MSLAVPAVVIAMQAVVTALRMLDVRHGAAARNLEASYHAILTAKALLRTPLSDHWGLPIVSLGAANDKGISWGAAVATAQGDYVYSSFPPAGFWLPTVVAAMRGGNLGIGSLVAINGLLAATAALLLYVLVSRAVGRMGRATWASRGAGLAAAALYVSSAEALQSHGVVYWPHSMLQPIMLGQLLMLERLLLQPDPRTRRRLLVALGALTMLACYTEWTAYVFSGLSGALLLAVPELRRRARTAALVLWGVAGSTAALLAFHFIAVIGLDGALEAWQARFLARSGGSTPLLHLLTGYALSFGGVVIAALVILALAAARPAFLGHVDVVTGALLLFSLGAVLENAVLLQHATQFTFDRLKVGIPLALVVGIAVARLSRRGMAAAGAMICLAAYIGFSANQSDALLHERWRTVDQANRTLVAQAGSVIDLDCATIGTNTHVRAYTNLAFDRGVHEGTAAGVLPGIGAEERSCGTVFVVGEMVFTDLPRFTSITVVRGDGAAVTFVAEET